LGSIIFLLKTQVLSRFHHDNALLWAANTFFLCLSLITLALQIKSMKNKNPNVFIRSVMGGILIKMFGTLLAVFVYVIYNDYKFDKSSMFVGLCFYLFYLMAEVTTLMKLNKK
jgi:heme/copper-type cytochrome/quinol oxidase subunit 3